MSSLIESNWYSQTSTIDQRFQLRSQKSRKDTAFNLILMEQCYFICKIKIKLLFTFHVFGKKNNFASINLKFIRIMQIAVISKNMSCMTQRFNNEKMKTWNKKIVLISGTYLLRISRDELRKTFKISKKFLFTSTISKGKGIFVI